MRRLYFASFIYSYVLTSLSLTAQSISFEREYTYQASELDSKSSSRTIALNQLRAEILNEVGVYLETESNLFTKEIKGEVTQEFHETIRIVTGGLVQLTILDESWDGKLYSVKASITIDEQEIKESIDKIIADESKYKELVQVQAELEASKKEIENLKLQYAADQSKNEFEKNFGNHYNSEVQKINSNNYQLEGNSSLYSEDYIAAITNFTESINLNPDNKNAYLNRGICKAKMKDFVGAKQDFNSYIELNPESDIGYYNRGIVFLETYNYDKAIKDFSTAIQLNRTNAHAFSNRGVAKSKLKDYRGAIKDYKAAIMLTPNDSEIHFNIALSHFYLGELDQACESMKRAFELGNKKAEKHLLNKCN